MCVLCTFVAPPNACAAQCASCACRCSASHAPRACSFLWVGPCGSPLSSQRRRLAIQRGDEWTDGGRRPPSDRPHLWACEITGASECMQNILDHGGGPPYASLTSCTPLNKTLLTLNNSSITRALSWARPRPLHGPRGSSVEDEVRSIQLPRAGDVGCNLGSAF